MLFVNKNTCYLETKLHFLNMNTSLNYLISIVVIIYKIRAKIWTLVTSFTNTNYSRRMNENDVKY